MKTKTPKNSPIAILYTAAKEIVDGTRRVFSEQGQDAREIRLPILMQGTDMRVTIEAGPKIAARNAVEHAQMQASGKPVEPIVSVRKTIEEVRFLLGIYASEIKDSRKFDEEDWEKGCQDRKTFDRILAALGALHEMEKLI